MSDAVIINENYCGCRAIALEYGRTFWYSLRRADQALLQSELAEDLLAVAGVVMIADRAFRRRFRLGELTRTYHIQASVNRPDLWEAAAGELVQALSFLSGDNWTFTFRKRDRKRDKESDLPLQQEESPRQASIALFSGGLDSFCGAAYLRKEQGKKNQKGICPVFLSSYAQELSRLQGLLQNLFGSQNAYLHVPIYFRASPKKIVMDGRPLSALPERTRRTRSFFYLTQAAAFAWTHKISKIYIFENGVLALNLPIRKDRTGARSTRHAHPLFLNLMQSFLRSLSPDQEAWSPEVINPFADDTKAEILDKAGLLEDGSPCLDLIADTTSCWGYPNYTVSLRRKFGRKDITHCGFCLPCLVRRLALKRAGVDDPQKLYAYDVFQVAKEGVLARPEVGEPWGEAKVLREFAKGLKELDEREFYRRYTDNLVHLDSLNGDEQLSKTYDMMQRFAKAVLEYLGGSGG
jgi:7-cyano-7-deazaguanine synthase in queuosine biosynthesis